MRILKVLRARVLARSGLYTEFRMGKFIRKVLNCQQTRAIIRREFPGKSLFP